MNKDQRYCSIEWFKIIVEIDFGSLGLPKEWESLGGCIRTRPDYWKELGGLDGFFISHLRKNNS